MAGLRWTETSKLSEGANRIGVAVLCLGVFLAPWLAGSTGRGLTGIYFAGVFLGIRGMLVLGL